MSSYYKLFEITSMLHTEGRGIKWSEAYDSIPNIGVGSMVTAVKGLFDPNGNGVAAVKASLANSEYNVTNFAALVGVVGVDIPLCELLEAAVSAGWTEATDSTDTGTKQGCTCSDSFTWEDVTYTECTTDDWATPWCAVQESGCGICGFTSSEMPPTGCWDECSNVGTIEYQVTEFLRDRSIEGSCPDSIAQEAVDPCALEGLRGSFTCGTTAVTPCDDSVQASEWSTMFGMRNPYNTGSSYTLYSPSTNAPVESGEAPTDCGGEFADATECGTCNAAIQPTCGLTLCEEEITWAKANDEWMSSDEYCYAGLASACGWAGTSVAVVGLLMALVLH
eukprot:NODE_10510_length_1346_cov_5.705496.p1 GENE.NODE_10510_length_1346_cov_5.705496~~NODE_10510_length_1346_cov_5.705496.p1  ORF type:complete len:344 (-),score=92.47 NODE_10510_length_1346_cov_5.705496:315-1319(-)